MGLKVDAKARVAGVTQSKTGKTMIRLKISRKHEDKWIMDFDGWVTLGAESAKKPPQKGDIIKILSCDLKTVYAENSNEPKYIIYLFDHEYIKSLPQDDYYAAKKYGEPASKYSKEIPPTDLPF